MTSESTNPTNPQPDRITKLVNAGLRLRHLPLETTEATTTQLSGQMLAGVALVIIIIAVIIAILATYLLMPQAIAAITSPTETANAQIAAVYANDTANAQIAAAAASQTAQALTAMAHANDTANAQTAAAAASQTAQALTAMAHANDTANAQTAAAAASQTAQALTAMAHANDTANAQTAGVTPGKPVRNTGSPSAKAGATATTHPAPTRKTETSPVTAAATAATQAVGTPAATLAATESTSAPTTAATALATTAANTISGTCPKAVKVEQVSNTDGKSIGLHGQDDSSFPVGLTSDDPDNKPDVPSMTFKLTDPENGVGPFAVSIAVNAMVYTPGKDQGLVTLKVDNTVVSLPANLQFGADGQQFTVEPVKQAAGLATILIQCGLKPLSSLYVPVGTKRLKVLSQVTRGTEFLLEGEQFSLKSFTKDSKAIYCFDPSSGATCMLSKGHGLIAFWLKAEQVRNADPLILALMPPPFDIYLSLPVGSALSEGKLSFPSNSSSQVPSGIFIEQLALSDKYDLVIALVHVKG